MSMLGDVAVEVAMNDLQARIEKNKDLPPEEQLAKLKDAIEEIRRAAKSGWY